MNPNNKEWLRVGVKVCYKTQSTAVNMEAFPDITYWNVCVH